MQVNKQAKGVEVIFDTEDEINYLESIYKSSVDAIKKEKVQKFSDIPLYHVANTVRLNLLEFRKFRIKGFKTVSGEICSLPANEKFVGLVLEEK